MGGGEIKLIEKSKKILGNGVSADVLIQTETNKNTTHKVYLGDKNFILRSNIKKLKEYE